LEKSRWFFKGLEITFWTVWTLDTRIKRNILVNQLSEAKIYAHLYVNKSITARFKIIGIYDFIRNLSSIWLRIFSLHISKKHHMFIAVLSANVKSSTSTMVYVAGIFHLASIE
jgi:hypothetical protein